MDHRCIALGICAALATTAVAQQAGRTQEPRDREPALPAWIDLSREHTQSDVIFALAGATADATRLAVMESVGAVGGKVLWPGRIFMLTLPEGSDLRAALVRLNADPRVKYAEPNAIYHVINTPNDPSYSLQWGWNQGNDADIDAPEAWDSQTDGSGVVVAVIDTGVEYTHSDLAANMWVNPDEIAGNGLDDDSNGYVDDVYGADVINGDGDPMDDHYHGTHVAGTIGAVGNNGVGVTGACWTARIMAVKFLSSGGSGTEADAVLSVNYAVSEGAVVSNNSWGGFGFDQGLYDAIEAAGEECHLFCAAAGNSSIDIEGQDWIPGGYDLDSILCVAASDASDNRAWFSNWGPVSVDLAAPGDSIYSTFLGDSYTYLSGTSMATPHVAGVATMLYSEADGRADHLDVKQWLMDSVDPIAAWSGLTVTGGRLNFDSALAQIPAWPVLPASGILLSQRGSFNPGGLPSERGDVLHLDPITGAYAMIFDCSDVLAGDPNLDALEVLSDGSLLLSFDAALTIPCLQGGPDGDNVDDSDVVRFVPLTYGDDTAGQFEFYFDGSDVALDADGEDVDGLAMDAAGNLLVSTSGSWNLGGGVSGKNEDVLLFAPTSLGANTAGGLTLFFNGRDDDVKLGQTTENTDAIHFDDAAQVLTISTAGDFRVPVNQLGQDDDLADFAGTQWGADTNGTFTIPFDGAAYQLDPKDIDAVVVIG
jgi:subtilisin family serine protease